MELTQSVIVPEISRFTVFEAIQTTPDPYLLPITLDYAGPWAFEMDRLLYESMRHSNIDKNHGTYFLWVRMRSR